MKITKTVGAVFAAALLAGLAMPLTGAHAVSITNGSFEISNPTFSGGFETLSAGSSVLTGWTINSGSIDYINTYWQAANGSYSLDMDGTSAGTISQNITGLTSGVTYRVSFELSGNPDNGPTDKTLGVMAGVGPSSPYTFAIGSNTRTSMDWVTETFLFTATGTSELLTFMSTTPGSWGPALDNVSISAVPLPATWIMFLGGILGFARLIYPRQKRTKITLPVA